MMKDCILHRSGYSDTRGVILDASSIMYIRTVSELSGVFPKELPGMPPHREIEFIIELVPGTAPIFKKPYRFTTNQLAELKE
jgi:hypothetical protein